MRVAWSNISDLPYATLFQPLDLVVRVAAREAHQLPRARVGAAHQPLVRTPRDRGDDVEVVEQLLARGRAFRRDLRACFEHQHRVTQHPLHGGCMRASYDVDTFELGPEVPFDTLARVAPLK